MKKTYAYFLILCLLFIKKELTAQEEVDSIAKIITISHSRLKDCLLVQNHLWVLREDGIITRVNYATNTITDSIGSEKKL